MCVFGVWGNGRRKGIRNPRSERRRKVSQVQFGVDDFTYAMIHATL